MILTPDQFREHVVTAVEDDALRRLLDAAEAAIVEYAGPSGADIVELVEGGRFTDLFLSRAAASVSLVREWNGSDWDSALTVDDDYRVVNSTLLRRIDARWAGKVEVTYTPLNDAAKRIQVQVKLVELELQYSPLLSGVQAGPYSEQRADNSAMNYMLERQLILSTLRPAVGMLVF